MPGGIVNIETILSQIASVKVGLDSIVDAVLDSCNVTVTAAKCKVAKFKIKSLTKLMTSLLIDVQNSISEMMSSIDASQFNKSLSELIADPSKFLTSANGSSQNILLLANSKSGLLELLLFTRAPIGKSSSSKFPKSSIAAYLNFVEEFSASPPSSRPNNTYNVSSYTTQFPVANPKSTSQLSTYATSHPRCSYLSQATQKMHKNNIKIFNFINSITIHKDTKKIH